MKRKTITVLLLCLVFMLILPTQIIAAEPSEPQSIGITVVVPRNENPPTPPPDIPLVFPVHVWESRENGRREIVRVYELREHESPAYIPRESFERDGFFFEFAEMVRREMPVHSAREHTEVISISTQTNDLATILNLLGPTLNFVAEDGYFGNLALDVSSIRVESQGTRSSSHAVTRTREFPHLSNADTALIPRTITENGRTYNLTNVDWQTQSSAAIDYTQLATSFTAVATFTGTATRTSTIGYTTTAEYRGQIAKITTGRTEFTATFIGIPIVVPIVDAIVPSVATDYVGNEVTEDEVLAEPELPTEEPEKPNKITEVDIIESPILGCNKQPYEYEEPTQGNRSGGIPVPITILLIVGCSVLAFFAGKKGKAMLAAARKAACLLLCIGLTFAFALQVYAHEIPPNPFGAQHTNEVHLDPQANNWAYGNNAVHFAPNVAPEPTVHSNPNNTSNHNNSAIHFAPNATPTVHFNPNITSGSYEYGEHIGVLTIYRLSRTVNVFAGATMSSMDYGAGHFSFTGLNFGNTGLIGHNRGRTNGFFDFVRYLRYGDIIYFEANGVIRRYEVAIRYIIHETNLSSLMQFGDNRLTLITCVEYQRTQRRVAVALEI